VAGVVQSVSGTGGSLTIVVTDPAGFWRTVKTSAATTYTDDGSPATAAAVTVGTFISATGTVDVDRTDLDAATVAVGAPSGPGGGAGKGGPPAGGPPAGGSSGGGSSGGGSSRFEQLTRLGRYQKYD
jgi:hypothetical protein